MGFFGRLLGIEDESDRARQRGVPGAGAGGPRSGASAGGATLPTSDEQAIERYRYMLRTAPPETLEQAHAEAFAKLTPEQRRTVLAQLTDAAPAAERAAVAATSPDDPQALARVATRAEVRQPGLMERTLGGGMAGGMGFGASLLSSFAMGFVGSMVAQSFMSAIGGFGPDAMADGGDGASDGDATAENDASAGDEYADTGMDDGGDFGGDFDV